MKDKLQDRRDGWLISLMVILGSFIITTIQIGFDLPSLLGMILIIPFVLIMIIIGIHLQIGTFRDKENKF